ncbi:alpha/beta family hydrolase [Blastococcus brunescens]|uniref:Alpha/beta family hydrolase n=1 Tax=Blastococcus brunescens TaxID=1564165 RepID=A0ABZ1B2E1_9ACTN|nr:alpha/beta family hydrolase [Blastococcus sp. BMG 8361]WRL63514.1 alpha/beta family hydrolase [Blastococcus sp. BMG 8361]
MSEVHEIGTPHGPARAHVTTGGHSGTLVLGHGAGGGVESVDLVQVATEAAGAGWRVVRVEQPWRVAGKRIAAAPPKLDEGWSAVLGHLRAADLLTGPLVLGGRSAGARVACRTAADQGAAGVLALAFPLHPPGRPEKSRAAELTAVPLPLVVVQGETDAFGGPAEVAAVLTGQAGASVYAVPGDHSLERNVDVVAAAALSWLDELTAG